MTQVNLLPWREQARQKQKKLFGLAVLAAILAALFCVAMMHLYYVSLLKVEKKRIDYLQAELDKEQLALGEYNKNKKLQLSVVEELNFIHSLRENNYDVVKLLNELVKIVPEGVSFNEISRTGSAIVVKGRAKSNLQITLLLKNIAASSLFKQPDLTEISGKENTVGEEINFILKADQHE